MRHRSRAVRALTALALAAGLTGAAPSPQGDVMATVSGLRSSRGEVLACLTARPQTFPDCAKDPQALARVVPAATTVVIDFGPVRAGLYAISLFHDENGNGRLDKRLMMPREGYGFSRDAPVMMGPPSFRQAAFAVAGRDEKLTIRMRYIF